MGYFRRQDSNAKLKEEYKNDELLIEDIAYNGSEIEGELAFTKNIYMPSSKIGSL